MYVTIGSFATCYAESVQMSCNIQHAITHHFQAFCTLQDESPRQSITEVPSTQDGGLDGSSMGRTDRALEGLLVNQ
jgi:hypothetical protein